MGAMAGNSETLWEAVKHATITTAARVLSLKFAYLQTMSSQSNCYIWMKQHWGPRLVSRQLSPILSPVDR